MNTPYDFRTEDDRPATCFMGGPFLIGSVDGADDYRLAFATPTGPVKWLYPDGLDAAFTREELTDLHTLLGRVLAGSVSSGEVQDGR